jgi:hypothetical protein
MTMGLHHLPYEERLRSLGLLPLSRRHERGDVIEAFKIVKGIEQINEETFFTRKPDHRTRGHSLKLDKQHCRLDSRRNFFSQRVINAFNSCPPTAVTSENVIAFKKAITTYYDPRD